MNYNIEALNDTVKKVKNKVGEYQFEKTSLATSNDELKTLNNDLQSEVDKQKGRVIYINNAYVSLLDENARLNQMQILNRLMREYHENGGRSVDGGYTANLNQSLAPLTQLVATANLQH